MSRKHKNLVAKFIGELDGLQVFSDGHHRHYAYNAYTNERFRVKDRHLKVIVSNRAFVKAN